MTANEMLMKLNMLWSLIPNPPTYEEFSRQFPFEHNSVLTKTVDPNIQTTNHGTYNESLSHINMMSNIIHWGWGMQLKPIINPQTMVIESWTLV